MMRRFAPPFTSFVAGFVIAAVVSCAALDRGERDAARLPPATADAAAAVPQIAAEAVAKAAAGNVVGAIADLGNAVGTVTEVARQTGEDGKPIGYGGAAMAILAILFQRFRRVLPEWLVGRSASGAARQKNKSAPISS